MQNDIEKMSYTNVKNKYFPDVENMSFTDNGQFEDNDIYGQISTAIHS